MQIHDFLGAVRTRLRRSILLEGWSRVLIVIILTAVAVFVLDCFAPLPSVIRLALLCGYVFIIFDTVYWRLIKPLRLDMSDHNVVDLMERRLPELNGRAFVVLEDLPLVEADRVDLDNFLDDAALKRMIPAPYMKQWFASSGAVCVALLLLIFLNGDFFTTAVDRMLLPFGMSEWDRSTIITGALERSVVAEDESMVFVFERKTGQLDPLRVEWENTEGRQGSKTFDSIASPWRQALQLPPGYYDFVVRSGDSKAVRCSGQVVARPRLENVKVRIEAPAYAKLPSQNIDTFDVSVLPGSRLHFDIGLRMDDGRKLDTIAVWYNDAQIDLIHDDKQAYTVRGELEVEKAQSLVIVAADQDEIGMKPSPTFNIGVLSDNLPQIRLSGPRRSEKVSTAASVALRIDASDDYGIAQAKIYMRHEKKNLGKHVGTADTADSVDGADTAQGTAKKETKDNEIEEHDILVKKYESTFSEITERQKLRITDFATEGARLIVSSVAEDANTVTGPGIGRSNDIELLVVSEQELRRDLQQRITDVRERVQQSRDALMPALSQDDKVKQHARHASSMAQKAQESLQHVIRRWKENALPEEESRVLHRADSALRGDVHTKLLAAMDTTTARSADKALAAVYRMLSNAVDNNDLPHELSGLIEQQKNLAKHSKEFVLKYTIKEMDEAAKNAQAALAERQQDLAAQVRDWEQRLLDSNDSRYKSARDTARTERPAQQLSAASKNLASTGKRQKSVSEQKSAVNSMNKMYKQMQGSDGAGSMGEQLGKLAQKQEDLAKDLQAGLKGKEMRAEQRKLAELTKKLLEELKRKADKNSQEKRAQQHMEGAADSQKKASEAMSQNKDNKAQTEATAAANLLRQAEKALDDKKEDEKNKKDQIEIVTLLKRMRSDQTEVVSDALALHARIDPDKRVSFQQKRSIAGLDAAEKTMLRTLREKAYPALKEAKQEIAIWGLKRVEKSIDRSHKHLAKPALGERGIELCKVVLREIDRLLEIVEKLPKPNKSEESKGGGGGGGSPPPFPPMAQLNLLAQAQELLMHYTMADYGNALASDQGELASMIQQMVKTSRPGTRPEILLQRVAKAMDGAGQRLQQKDTGVHTQHQQRLAVSALQQIMREAKSSKSDGKGKPPKGDKKQQGDKQKSAPKGSSGSSAGGSTAGKAAGKPKKGGRGKVNDVIKAVIDQHGDSWFMNLPPKMRESLIEVNIQELPPGAQELYRRYLEILEDVKE